ncbi:transient receptor potential cation channel protein painless [Lucilia sericata]|uniref:transient receptor potential cation channel protein painless n=1 Tax=Lucilia sericata TaxID=13632 RepID=UPI0018A80CC0|nr:transient receptor potential cation channel protein painless [Lucilia sericata]
MSNKYSTIDISGCLADPQTQLSRALANRDIRDFRVALDMGAEPSIPDDKHICVFEKALQTHGCAEFVEECLKRDCNVNYINQHFNKAAINYAADSRDPKILNALLRYPGVAVDRKYANMTPLNSLAKNLNSENANDVASCIQMLLHYGASPNIPDQREMTPLHQVVKNRKLVDLKKREIIQMFLQQSDLDIDTYRDGELRTILKSDYAEFSLPPVRDGKTIDFDILMTHIRNGDMEKFQQQFPEYQLNISDKDNLKNTTKEENLPLLMEAIKRGAHEAFDLLMKNEVDYNAVLNGNTPLEVATVCGNWYALQKLLEQNDLKIRREDQPLITAIRKLNELPVNDFCDYRRCFYTLLDSEKIDVNEMDKSKSTPLHYAVKYRNNEAIRELLKRGAYIGIKSEFNELPIDGMNPEILEEHFDNCITSNGVKVGDNSYEILINYMNLMPQNSSVQKKSAHQLREEMPPIAFLAKSRDHRHLLQHPLITSFLFLKWHRLSVIFYINFLFYLFFAVSIITHTMLKFRESEHEYVAALFGIFSWIGICYMILRECLQFIMSPVNYFRSLINYMEILLIMLSIMTCSEPSYDKETQRNIAVCTFLLIAVELCFLVGSLPVSSISTHMLMLDAVFRSFLKSFLLYSIFVITFTLCFYIMFGKPEINAVKEEATSSAAKDGNDDDDGDDGEFSQFKSPLGALAKTIVMLTGEFDAGDLKFDTFCSYLLFLLFVFTMTIVLFNLLNGLAVSDTQAIKGQAELNGIIVRTNLLSRYEEVLTGRSERANFIVNHEPFRTICRRIMNLYPNYIAGKQIAILPNDNNKVLIPLTNTFEMKEMSVHKDSFIPLANHDNEKLNKILDPPVQFLPCCCSFITTKCSEMDRRTVKMAMAVIDKKSLSIQEQIRVQSTEKRLHNIEQKLEKMFEVLQDLQAR